MRVCPEAHVTRTYCILDDVFNVLPLYMMVNLVRSMRFPTDLSSMSLP